ncbi:MAG: excinuclease ABC subunit UvrC [Clostridiales bacterium]|nr:excinuclease ABC subunit UvrC [Clostridiales bacterium]
MDKNPKLAELRKKAMSLPLLPGVYIMKDDQNKIIYIGKAKALKNRVSQYFGSDTGHPEKVRQMVSRVDHFDYIIADSEFEALVLECSLIKQYMPKYNILLKDSKGYHYIRLSPPPYTRIYEARQKMDDGSRYLGPYVSSMAVQQSVDEVNRIFQLPTCSRVFPRDIGKGRPCLNYYIKQCCGPCTGRMSQADYAERLEQALEFLTHGGKNTEELLRRRMEEAAENLEFEKAARLRDRITAMRRISQKQKVVMSRVEEQDIIALAQGAGGVCFEVFRFTGGQLHDREHFLLDDIDTPAAARTEFIQRYYSLRDTAPPPQITVDGELEDEELLEQWLSEKAGRRVHVVQPQRGEQAQLVEMCRNNAAERIAQQAGMAGRDAAALDELARLLGLKEPPLYIESYDISNTGGSENVAGMVVFENGRPLKSAYRKFAIKTVVGQDDYASMREVLTRRMEEYLKHKEEGSGFGRLPDLILLDGGKGHVSVVKPVVDSYGLNIPVFGMVKDQHHRTRAIAEDGGEISITAKRSAFTLISAIQEEVHRYSIAFHRQKRAKRGIGTELTKIDGVGEARARALLRHFGTMKAIRTASVEELRAVRGVSLPAAEAVHAFFHTEET